MPLSVLIRAEQHCSGVMQSHAPLPVEHPLQPAIGMRAGWRTNEPLWFLATLSPQQPRTHGPQIKLGIVRQVLDFLDRPPFRTTPGVTPYGDAKHVNRLPDCLAPRNSTRSTSIRIRPLLSVKYLPAHLVERCACPSPVLDRPCQSHLHPDGEQRTSAPLPLVCLHTSSLRRKRRWPVGSSVDPRWCASHHRAVRRFTVSPAQPLCRRSRHTGTVREPPPGPAWERRRGRAHKRARPRTDTLRNRFNVQESIDYTLKRNSTTSPSCIT